MKSVRDIKEYIFKDQLEIRLYLNKVDIINYKELGHFDNNKVFIYHNTGLIKIIGNNLVVTRLLNNEVLINGIINRVELGE